MASGDCALTYVVPLRRFRAEPIDELAGYLLGLADGTEVDDAQGRAIEVIVVDGSAPALFAAHARTLRPPVRHLPVAVHAGRSGKVNGVLTGLAEAGCDRVVLADDDVRWTRPQLCRVAALLDEADVIRPQNYFDPLPWHARWDTGRMLVNRGLGADYPGTLALRSAALAHTGGYDADALFENLELLRTVRAGGGVVRHAPDLLVRRSPPTAGHFLRQRTRQAYDSFAQPARLAAELAIAPLAAGAVRSRRPAPVVALSMATLAVAERGRRRAGGRAVFPASTTAMAPLWLAERAVCAWLALGWRLRGGVPYAGARFPRAASSRRALRRSLAARARSAPARRPPRPRPAT